MATDLLKGDFKCQMTFLKSVENPDESVFLGVIEGYASTPHLDREYDIISDKALENASSQLLENDSVFFNHKHQELPIGRVIASNHIKGKGIFVRVGISKNAPHIWTAIEDQSLKKFSIFGRFGEVEWQKLDVDGKELDIRVIKEVELWEVSVVGIPANAEATFNQAVVKHLDTAAPITKLEKTGAKIMENGQTEEIQETVVETTEVQTQVPDYGSDISEMKKSIGDLASALNGLIELQKAAVTAAKPVEPKVIETKPTGKSTARKTPEIIQPEKTAVFKTVEEYEFWEMEQFGKALQIPGEISIDLLGTLDLRESQVLKRKI